MKSKETLSYIEKLLVDGEYEFQPPEKLDNIIEIEEKEIWYKEPLIVKVLTNKANKDNKLVYQNIVKINDKEIYITEISDKKSIIYFYDEVLFFVDNKITCIPIHYILTALLKEDPYNHISNGIYKVRKEEDIEFLVLNKSELEQTKLHIIKYQDKLNECLTKKYVYEKVDTVLLCSTIISLLANINGLKYISSILLVNFLFDLYNNHYIKKCIKMNGQDVDKLDEYQTIYDNIVNYIIDKSFKMSNDFSIIKEQKQKTLLQNEFLHLYTSNIKGYINNELLNQTSLFINNIEFWHGDYEKESIPVVVFDNCIYILKEKPIAIPFAYILESIYEDNPVDSINKQLENDKIKQLKR